MKPNALRVALVGVLPSLLPLALAGQVIENGSFEQRAASNPSAPAAWNVGGQGYEVALDSTVSFGPGLSLRMEQLRAGSFGVASQAVDAVQFHGHRITLSGQIRTEGVESGTAGLWLRLDGLNRQTLFLDNMSGRGASGTSDWTPFSVTATVGPDAARITLGALMPGSGTAWYDDLTVHAVPLLSLPPASDSAAAYLDRALDIMEANSIRAELVDWSSFRTAAHDEARGAASLEEMHGVIRGALRRLGDSHSFFMDPAAVEAWSTRPVDEATGDSGLAGELINGRIGHISIPGFGGGAEESTRAFAREIQSLIESLDRSDVCGWVVDLRGNSGGNMWPMLAGIGPILGPGTVGYFVSPQGEFTAWGYDGSSSVLDDEPMVTVSPSYSLRVSDPPVAVLTGPRTASSGEAIVVAFRARPGTRSFGSSTAGVSTSNSSMELSDGAMMLLTTSTFADRGRFAYGSSIPPDEVVEADGAAPLEAAVVWLSSLPICAAR